MREGRPGRFWMIWQGGGDDPLALEVPGTVGGTLAVFSFRDEASLYLRVSAEDGEHAAGESMVRSVGTERLLGLLLEGWSRFERVALDPVPGPESELLLPLVSMSREDFADLLAREGAEADAIPLGA